MYIHKGREQASVSSFVMGEQYLYIYLYKVIFMIAFFLAIFRYKGKVTFFEQKTKKVLPLLHIHT